MEKWLKQREELLAKCKSLVDSREAANESLTDEDRELLTKNYGEVEDLDGKIKQAKADSALVAKIKGAGGQGNGPTGSGIQVKERNAEPQLAGWGDSLGDFFVKETEGKLPLLKHQPGASVSTTEYDYDPEGVKAPATQTSVWAAGTGPILTDYDRTIVRRTARVRPTIADLLGVGRVSGQAISYFIEGPTKEGGYANVAEGAAKPQISFPYPTAEQDPVRKIAGWIKFTDEFLEDLPFLKTEIDERLLYELKMHEEAQLLQGSGTGQNLLGLLNRSGVQTEAAASVADNADAIFRAATKVTTATDLSADGLVIHPLDYQQFRLSKDGNGQYFGGGYFQGQYGNGGVLENPPLWGLRTVVTPAVGLGTPLVGNFRQAATLYRKGGVRVDATNSHVDDFTNNLVTVRVEERIALAVRKPLAFVKVTLDDGVA